MKPSGLLSSWKRLLRITIYSGALTLTAYGCWQAYAAYQDIRDLNRAMDMLAQNPAGLERWVTPF